MHFHLPKPLHGSRQFVGEVGIVVLGVLIALGAQQIAEDIHERYLARQAEDQIRAELAYARPPRAAPFFGGRKASRDRVSSEADR